MLRPRETRNQKRLSWRKYSLWLWRFYRRALVPIGTFGSCPRAASGHAAVPPSSVMNWRRFQLIELHSVPAAKPDRRISNWR